MFDKGDSVLVIGVGRSGLATAEVLRARNVGVVAYDDRTPQELRLESKQLAKLGVPLVGQAELENAAKSARAAVLSPGVPPINPVVLAVQRAGVPVYSEVEVAYTLSHAPIIAVTGTKGKSTTTALIGHLLRQAGRSVRVGGNIGNPLIRETAAAGSDEIVIAEVSSFQLESIQTFAPRISLLLNITPDHLDRYPSIEEYAEAKFRIFANQGSEDAFVGNADDAYAGRLREGSLRTIPCPAFWFSMSGQRSATMTVRDAAIVWQPEGKRSSKLLPVADLQLRGRHNVANAMAAALVALIAGAPADAVRKGLRSFAPLPHRLQTVATAGGVTWVDDSKASNPAATLRALESFDAPMVLIAGGSSKNADFEELGQAISAKTKAVVLIGETAPQIGAHVMGPPLAYASSMDEAVDVAAANSSPGDIVLLSPACASFDMFGSAEQRGEAFAQAIRKRPGAQIRIR